MTSWTLHYISISYTVLLNLPSLLSKMQTVIYPFLLRCWRKKSFAASLMAFSGVTKVRFTAAPEDKTIEH